MQVSSSLSDPISSLLAARDVLQTTLAPEIGLPAIQIPPAPGRTRHWSTFVLIGGAALGVVYIIIGIVATLPSLWIPGGFLFFTNAVGAYYTKKFALYKQLEDYLKILTKQLSSLRDTALLLKKNNIELTDTANKLQKTIDETPGIFKKGAEEVEGKAKELDVTVKKLADAEAKLAKYEHLPDDLIRQNAELKSQLDQNQVTITTLGKKVDQLTTTVTTMSDQNIKLGQEIQLLKNNEDVLNSANGDLKNTIARAEEQSKIMQETCKAQISDKKFDTEVLDLTKAGDRVASHIDELKDSDKKLAATESDVAKLLQQLQEVSKK